MSVSSPARDARSGHGKRIDFLWALSAQGLLLAATLINGVLLARGTTRELRGYIVLFAVTLTVTSLVATFGLPDLILRLKSARASRPLAVVGIAVLMTSAIALPALLKPPGSPPAWPGQPLASALVFASLANALLQNVVLLHRGLRVTSSIRVAYAIVLVSTTAVMYVTSHASLTWPRAVCCMLLAEGSTTALLLIYCRRAAHDADAVELTLRLVAKDGTKHAVASLGTLLADRGVVLLTSALGGLQATAIVSVAQNAASPVSLPASALGPSVLMEASSEGRSRWALASRVTAAVAAALAIPACYWLVVPLYGPAYSDLRGLTYLIASYGLASALWRVQHLRLRGQGRPNFALASDVLAVGTFAIVASATGVVSSASSLLPIMNVYAFAGLLGALVLPRLTLHARGRWARRVPL